MMCIKVGKAKKALERYGDITSALCFFCPENQKQKRRWKKMINITRHEIILLIGAINTEIESLGHEYAPLKNNLNELKIKLEEHLGS